MQLSETTLYKNHGAKIGYWTATALATADGAEVRLTYAKTMDGKPVTKVDPIVGKNIGRANETTPQQQAVLELESRVNKQLDKGYVRTLAEATAPATNTLGLKKPMLAHPIHKVKEESIDWGDAWAQPKLDGHRTMVKGILYSRQGKEILLPHIRDWLGDHQLLDVGLDGELYVHGTMLQDIGSLIKKPREESLQLQYHVYDVVSPVPYADRHAYLADVLSSALAAPDSPIRLVPAIKVTDRAALDALHRKWLAGGYEGSILRHGKAGYEDDKRSGSLLKVKDFDDTEFKVINYKLGTPYTQFGDNGEVVAIYQVPVWEFDNGDGQTFEATAQGDMRQKHEQAMNAASFVGRLATVQHFGRSKDGLPLLPVVLRWKEDV